MNNNATEPFSTEDPWLYMAMVHAKHGYVRGEILCADQLGMKDNNYARAYVATRKEDAIKAVNRLPPFERYNGRSYCQIDKRYRVVLDDHPILTLTGEAHRVYGELFETIDGEVDPQSYWRFQSVDQFYCWYLATYW